MEGCAHYDQALALYDPAQHPSLATRFGQDVGVAILSYRSWALWMLGYIEAAFIDLDQAIKDARKIGHAATLAYALFHASITHLCSRNYAAAKAEVDEAVASADEKGMLFWKNFGMILAGWCLAVTGEAADAIRPFSVGLAAGHRSAGGTALTTLYLPRLALAYAELADSMTLGAASVRR